MGKRKTRKRSRRSKKGGMLGLSPEDHGAKSLCIWYGNGNSGINPYTYKTGYQKDCGELVKNEIRIEAERRLKRKFGD